MKLLTVLLAVLILAMFTGCASTTAQEAAAVSPGALASPTTGMDCPECPPDCEPADCEVTCEELPDGTCLVTCTKDGEVLCQTVCDPEECDMPCTETCEDAAPMECTPGNCGL